MPVLTPARLGIARLGATRLGYPVAGGAVLPRYALLGVARLGATRLNWHGPQVYVSIGGVQYATARPVAAQYVVDGSLSITDTLNETPNTARLTTHGFIPTVGQDVIVTLGSRNNLRREFGGRILSLDQRYVGTPANYQHDLNLIDFTWGLNKRKVRQRYTATTVAVIAADLVSTYASGYTVQIAADIGAAAIDEITFTETDLTACLTQLTKRVGGDWYCDYHKVVKVFYRDASVTDPTILNAVHRTLTVFAVTRDLSQVLTRVSVEGGGVTAAANVAVGETILPLDGDAGWYPPAGGTVVSGPQRITYTGVAPGGGGGLVGPGAAPTAMPTLTLASGAGIESGSHDYAVTFVTASGESKPSPIATIAVGALSAPASAPVAGAPTIGTGPNPGSHDYAVTFVTASGETPAGPSVTKATGLTAAPGTSPTPGTPTDGAGVDDGSHDYAVTFVTSIGETTPSPISGQVVTSSVAAPTTIGIATAGSFGSSHLAPGGTYSWKYTFRRNADGAETLPSPATNAITANAAGSSSFVSLSGCQAPPSGYSRAWYRTTNGGGTWKKCDDPSVLFYGREVPSEGWFNDGSADVSLGAAAPATNGAAVQHVPISGIPTGDANVTSRKLYRRSGGAGLKLVTTIANNTATTYTDTTANASLGAAPPATSTAYLQRIPLTAIPTGGALVTSRKIYRTAAGSAQLKLAATLADNTATAWTDTVTDAGLGANVPTANTATANQVAVSSIPIGAAAVTSRKLYRTAAAGSQLKLLATIADNTTTTYTDTTADAGLGANVPTADSSGLTQPSGNVPAQSTSLIVAGTGAFSAAGGWAVIGNGAQVIRYTGLSATALTGIPATGAGAIVATIGYNSTVTAAPQLTGIPASGAGAIRHPILKGDEVNLWVQVDDVAAQTALAALIGGDGIQEDTIQDRRLSATEARARGEAWLAIRRDVHLTLRYQTRDINTRAGRTQAVNLGPPFNLTADFMIQTVTESAFAPALFPTFDVTASSVRFSFDDFLRLIKKAA